MSLGRVLALDYGTRRIGVAMSDPGRVVASPLCVVAAETAIEDIRLLVEEHEADLIVVGLPVSLSGHEGRSAEGARRLGQDVGAATGLQVEFVDERFTTSGAERAMIEGKVKRRDRRAKVDKVAAALILQHFLDRRT